MIVSGLPVSASWQDLKDFFRQAGDVIYSDVDRHGGGIVEFASKSDQEYAITKLDDTEFVSEYRNQGEKAYVRVKKPRDQMTDEERENDKEDKPRGRDSRSRSPRKDSKRRGSSSRSRSPSERRSSDKKSDNKDDDKERKDAKDDKDDTEDKEEKRDD